MLAVTALSALLGAAPGVAVFESGQGGYHTYRIPSMLRMPHSGTLLLFAEGRKDSGADHGGLGRCPSLAGTVRRAAVPWPGLAKRNLPPRVS